MFQRSCSESKEEQLLSQEDALINSEGPTLGQFAEPPSTPSPFSEEFGPDAKSSWLRVKHDNNSNIRLFYYCLLCVCFERDCHKEGETYSQHILANFKMQVYPECLQLTRFNVEEVDQRYREYYKDRILKKVLVEFLQLMNYSQCGVLEMLRRYPIIDTIMILAIRSMLCSATIKYASIKTQLLADYFHNVIGLKIAKADNQYALVGTRISVLEEQEYAYVIKEEPFLKERRVSLTNNYSSASDGRTNEIWEDIPEIPFNKPAKLPRLTGLEMTELTTKKPLIQRVKQHSMDPTMSLDLDNILVIPKRSAYEEEDNFLEIPGQSTNEDADDRSRYQFIHSPAKPPRMTEDPRMYIPAATSSPAVHIQSPPIAGATVPSTSNNLELIKEEFQNLIYDTNKPVVQPNRSEKTMPFSNPPSPFKARPQKSLDAEMLQQILSKKHTEVKGAIFTPSIDGLCSPRGCKEKFEFKPTTEPSTHSFPQKMKAHATEPNQRL